MIRILIVDDEPLFREYLRKKINWQDYGFNIIGEAKNGVEALELTDELYPDIVLTDINMPHMNGLELTEELYKRYPDMGVILITGHSEFEYARKAVKLGVADYILKPFQKEELLMTLLKFRNNIKTSHELKARDQTNKELLTAGIINNLLLEQSVFTDKEIKAELDSLGMKVTTVKFVVTVLRMHMTGDEEIAVWQFAVGKMLKEYIKTNRNHFVLSDHHGNVVSILEVEEDWQDSDHVKIFRKFTDMVSKNLEFKLSAGIGSCQKGFGRVRHSYIEALSVLNQHELENCIGIFTYDLMKEENKDISIFNVEINEKLMKFLREKNEEEVIRVLDELYEHISSKRIAGDYVQVISMGLLSLLISFITYAGKNIEDVFGTDFSPNALDTLHSYYEQHHWIKKLFSKTVQYMIEHRKTRSYEVAKKAREYVEVNYVRNDFTVAEIAKAQFINQTYLRSMFKKEMKMTVSEYITGLRLEKAKELLIEDTYTLAYIAEKVGYSDASYLSKSFKKHFGIAPKNYINLKG
ncbi:response regulator transcription factor [Vallitalea okinawensis]|uniref:response regulator transcription factor n=1 Tax=Vallitalea okinawensis TaxID=2078660 RepID=UPI000CFA8422|nr:response regulator [Vallitalea okinawensis]